jgi:hypothetical protein
MSVFIEVVHDFKTQVAAKEGHERVKSTVSYGRVQSLQGYQPPQSD